MDFETVDQKFRNGDALTAEEKTFLVTEYQKKVYSARMRCVNFRFNILLNSGN